MKHMLRRFAGKTVAFLLVLAMMLGVFPVGAPGFTALAASNTVMLAEVYNYGQPATGRPIEEWVTIANITAQSQDLSGWRLRDYSASGTAQSAWTFPAGTILEPYSLLVVEKGVGGFVQVPAGAE